MPSASRRQPMTDEQRVREGLRPRARGNLAPVDSWAKLQTETSWQSWVIDMATVNGWWHHHDYDSRRSTPGWPDLTLIRPPQLLFVELKKEGGQVSTDQRYVIELLRACGSDVRVWYPHQRDDVMACLARR